jgi:hypothetical protein
MTCLIGFIGIISTPMMVEPLGMYLAATWSHPPGAAHKSINDLEVLRKSNFLFN